MSYLKVLFLIAVLGVSFAFGQDTSERKVPADFKSDGCSLFPDGNYRDCCVAHDLDYYHGGSCAERRASDDRLYRCVKNKKGWYNKFVAPIMWIGVRVGGVSFLPTPFRWGFGKKKKSKAKNAPLSPSAEPEVVKKEQARPPDPEPVTKQAEDKPPRPGPESESEQQQGPPAEELDEEIRFISEQNQHEVKIERVKDDE